MRCEHKCNFKGGGKETYPFTDTESGSGSSSAVHGVISESSSCVSSVWSYYSTAWWKISNFHNTVAFQSWHEAKPTDITSNFSLFPLMFMRELRHSPTTIPICLMRTTLLSRWLCMPPSMHCSNSKRKGPKSSEGDTSLFLLLLLWVVPDCSCCSSESSSRLTLSSSALLTYSCCSRGVCFTALGLAQAWDRDRNAWKCTQTQG